MERAVLETLASASGGLTRTELLARVLHYRALPDKFLFFSVRELGLLRAPDGPRYDDAERLLRRVLGEVADVVATPEMQKTLANREERRAKRAKQEARRAALFTAPPPPPPVVLTPERRVLVAGSPLQPFLGRNQRLSPIESVLGSSLAKRMGVVQHALANAGITPPIYHTVPAETAAHPYEETDRQVRLMMVRYPPVVWSRLPIEREMREQEEVMREYETRKRALNRAVDALEKRKRVERIKEGSLIRVRLVDGYVK